jgi:hypothetical protein
MQILFANRFTRGQETDGADSCRVPGPQDYSSCVTAHLQGTCAHFVVFWCAQFYPFRTQRQGIPIYTQFHPYPTRSGSPAPVS